MEQLDTFDSAGKGGTEANPSWGDEIPESAWDSPEVDNYSDEICLAALHGQRLPSASIEDLPWVVQLCIIRGIRHHHGFATELRGKTADLPEFTRALNARAIMSNEIPHMGAPEDFPYCIWYPDVASEETYRALVKQYPQMRYHVGRACAVAGYVDLYRELDLLPDISIAEEARDNCANGQSQQICDLILHRPIRWLVMNDYTRIVTLVNPRPARYGMNGDTAVRSLLDLRRRFDKPGLLSHFFGKSLSATMLVERTPRYFNITEDWSIDEFTSVTDDRSCETERVHPRPCNDEMISLLWNPLPLDLPWGDKDLLILMAAYYGNIDRYERLRRPTPVSPAEQDCIIRGIYHNTMFAKWWYLQPDNEKFQSAINARFIMSNDVSCITEETPAWALPLQIWYPLRADPQTYLEVARRNQEMKRTVARALIVANYQDEWDQLDFEPSAELVVEARASPNPHYLGDLRRRCEERGIMSIDNLTSQCPPTMSCPTHEFVEGLSTVLGPSISVDDLQWEDPQPAPYDGYGTNTSIVEAWVVVPEELGSIMSMAMHHRPGNPSRMHINVEECPLVEENREEEEGEEEELEVVYPGGTVEE